MGKNFAPYKKLFGGGESYAYGNRSIYDIAVKFLYMIHFLFIIFNTNLFLHYASLKLAIC